MLRYLYLLSLLLCIELTFSYDYIENPVKSIRNHGRLHDRRIVQKNREKKHLARQEYDLDRSPVEFDVAGFIQDEEPVEDAHAHHSNKRRQPARNYDYSAFIDSEMSKKMAQNNADYVIEENVAPEINLSALLAENVNSKLSANEISVEEDKAKRNKLKRRNKHQMTTNSLDETQPHHADKKNAFKHLKFPFFSHETPASLKPKKNRKRKLFSFTTCKMSDGTGMHYRENVSNEPTTRFKIKRSYEERLCPACKKKFLANLNKNKRRKKNPKKVIHNSRQFYENLPDDQVKGSEVSRAGEVGNKRRKREEDYRLRQLKELEEVQKKIDNVKIRLPMGDASPDLPTYQN